MDVLPGNGLWKDLTEYGPTSGSWYSEDGRPSQKGSLIHGYVLIMSDNCHDFLGSFYSLILLLWFFM